MSMQLSDFAFCGYISFSRAIVLNTEQDAKKLDKFLDTTDVLNEFKNCGPGKYFVAYNEGWDRGGDYKAVIISFVGYDMTIDETLNQLKKLKKKYHTTQKPFVLVDKLKRTHKETGKSYTDCVALLSERDQKILNQMNTESHFDAQTNLENFLNGFV